MSAAVLAGPPPGPAEMLLAFPEWAPLEAVPAQVAVRRPRRSAVPVGYAPEPLPGRAAERARDARAVLVRALRNVGKPAGRAPVPRGIRGAVREEAGKEYRYPVLVVDEQTPGLRPLGHALFPGAHRSIPPVAAIFDPPWPCRAGAPGPEIRCSPVRSAAACPALAPGTALREPLAVSGCCHRQRPVLVGRAWLSPGGIGSARRGPLRRSP